MGRGVSTFKQSDFIRAVKAARASGLDVFRTEIGPDGRLVLYHHVEAAEPAEETYEQWKARTGAGAS